MKLGQLFCFATLCLHVITGVALLTNYSGEETGNVGGTVMTKEAVMANMTTSEAVHRFYTMKPQHELLSLLEANLGEGLSHVAHASDTQIRSNMSKKSQPYMSGVEKARNMLNEMIAETQKKLDIETVTCIDFEERQLGLLSETRGAISQANAEAAAARGNVLDAEAQIHEMEKKLPVLKAELKEHEDTCVKDITQMTIQLGIVKEDLAIMGIILNMTQCDDATPAVTLVACKNCKHGHSIGIRHKGVSEALKRLKSPEAKAFVKQQLSGLFHDFDAGDGRRLKVAMVQDAAAMYFLGEANPGLGNMTAFPPNVLNTTDTPKATEKHDCVRTNKCTLGNSPNCERLNDRFTKIHGGIMDTRDDLEEKLNMRKRFCEETSIMYKDQINEMEERHDAELSRHAQSTKQQVDAERASHQFDAQHHDMEKDYYKKAKTCCTNKNNLISEICALEKIRGELMRMKGLSASIRDCEVGKWVNEPCTVTCGGGKQRSTRPMTVAPVNGSPCPALEMEQDCGMGPCPIDCVLEDWSGWSSCSAQCGGGVMTRQRQIHVHQQNDGEPCGATMESVACNIFACDADCQLADWTAWGTCSKACDTGVQRRYKKVTEPARGDGECAPAMAKSRMQQKLCNRFDCGIIANRSSGILTCKSKIDVIIAIDASASLRYEGWKASKKVAEELVGSMPGEQGVDLAVLVYSGPGTKTNYDKCLSGAATDLDTQCGVKWVTRFTNKTDEVLEKVKALTWTKKTTFTSMALSLAREELKYGRKDANAVVIMLTDGYPISPKRTGDEARELQKQAQVSWVLVGPSAPSRRYVRRNRWASRPLRNNLVRVKQFEQLTTPFMLNRIISNVCPVVG